MLSCFAILRLYRGVPPCSRSRTTSRQRPITHTLQPRMAHCWNTRPWSCACTHQSRFALYSSIGQSRAQQGRSASMDGDIVCLMTAIQIRSPVYTGQLCSLEVCGRKGHRRQGLCSWHGSAPSHGQTGRVNCCCCLSCCCSVQIDNESYDDVTVITIDSANRPGTLIEVVQCLTELNLSIRRARISSSQSWFVDGQCCCTLEAALAWSGICAGLGQLLMLGVVDQSTSVPPSSLTQNVHLMLLVTLPSHAHRVPGE
jgi:hypothetical protein